MMLRLGVCDDRKEDIASIEALVGRFFARYPEHPVQVSCFDSPYDLLEALEKGGGYDLYLLDIIMPHMSGIELKPIKEQAFFDVLFSCMEELAPENHPSVMIKTKLGLTRVQLSELVMIESFDHVRELTLLGGGTLETTATLSELGELLKESAAFLFPHRAYIVNMEYIRSIGNNRILMTNGKQVPVSKKAYAEVKSAYLEYMTRL